MQELSLRKSGWQQLVSFLTAFLVVGFASSAHAADSRQNASLPNTKNSKITKGSPPYKCTKDLGCTGPAMPKSQKKSTNGKTKMQKIAKSDEEWKKQLDPTQYHVLREKGTERAFTGPLYKEHRQGSYHCAGCGEELFASDAKFESGSGWPSFYKPSKVESVAEKVDSSHGMVRTEVQCARCEGHLGHVFPDGPNPTGLRYCINSASLKFEEKK